MLLKRVSHSKALFVVSYVHSLMSYKDLCATINPYSKSKISEDQTEVISKYYEESIQTSLLSIQIDKYETWSILRARLQKVCSSRRVFYTDQTSHVVG